MRAGTSVRPARSDTEEVMRAGRLVPLLVSIGLLVGLQAPALGYAGTSVPARPFIGGMEPAVHAATSPAPPGAAAAPGGRFPCRCASTRPRPRRTAKVR